MTVQGFYIEPFAGKDGFYWRIKNTNGRTAGVSEAYTRERTRDRIMRRLSKITGWPVRG